MLYLYTGTDREKLRAEANKAIAKAGKNTEVTRVSDANTVHDLQEALRGVGMFGGERLVVLDGVFANEEMREVVTKALPRMRSTEGIFYILEGKLDADTRKKIEKHAEHAEKFDAAKEKDGGEIFSLAYALKRGDKKALWVGYQRALLREEKPEAIHGVLFWGAKDTYMKTSGVEQARAAKLVAELAELPHEARRAGFELEYALEHYILGMSR